MSKELECFRNIFLETVDTCEFEIWATREQYEKKLNAIRKDLEWILADQELDRSKIEILLSAI